MLFVYQHTANSQLLDAKTFSQIAIKRLLADVQQRVMLKWQKGVNEASNEVASRHHQLSVTPACAVTSLNTQVT